MGRQRFQIRQGELVGVALIVMAIMVLGYFPRTMKASASKPDLMGNLTAHADAGCTPTPSPTPDQE